jgi:hypothetical protein
MLDLTGPRCTPWWRQSGSSARLLDAGNARIDMRISRYIMFLAFGVMVSGCTNQPASTTSGSVATAAVSFDGHYEGSVQVTGVASGSDIRECAIDSRLSVQVTNDTFIYAQSHPNIVNTAPDLTARTTTATYNATISADGSIKGDSGNLNGNIEGRVSGTHMAGSINGLVCYYKFVADRV